MSSLVSRYSQVLIRPDSRSKKYPPSTLEKQKCRMFEASSAVALCVTVCRTMRGMVFKPNLKKRMRQLHCHFANYPAIASVALIAAGDALAAEPVTSGHHHGNSLKMAMRLRPSIRSSTRCSPPSRQGSRDRGWSIYLTQCLAVRVRKT